jgi:two-component sensor histidine kinase
VILARFAAARIRRGLTSLEREVVKLGEGREIGEPRAPIAEINRMQAVLRDVGRTIAETEEKIEDERSLLHTTVDAIPVGVLLVTSEGRVSLANRKMQHLLDINTLRSLDDPDQAYRFYPDGTPYPLLDWPITRALRKGQRTEGEDVLHRVDGEMRNIIVSAVPVRNVAGEIIAAVSTCYDVTEIREALKRQQILLDEINHRVKNTLTAVQSIARLTVHSSENINDYLAAFEQRLFALSSAYNLLNENNWEGVDLSAVVRRILAPFSDAKRALIEGPPIMLPPKIALAFSAAVQELSTNAAKYGSLSNDAGNINVSWNNSADGMIDFSWIERGGPQVRVPTRRGFGLKLIQDILAADAGWNVSIDYDPAGLSCNLRVHGIVRDSLGRQGSANVSFGE